MEKARRTKRQEWLGTRKHRMRGSWCLTLVFVWGRTTSTFSSESAVSEWWKYFSPDRIAARHTRGTRPRPWECPWCGGAQRWWHLNGRNDFDDTPTQEVRIDKITPLRKPRPKTPGAHGEKSRRTALDSLDLLAAPLTDGITRGSVMDFTVKPPYFVGGAEIVGHDIYCGTIACTYKFVYKLDSASRFLRSKRYSLTD